jgi:outer membrane protein assembly factor BamB
MPISKYKPLLSKLPIILLSGLLLSSLLLTGCTSRFAPNGWAGPTVSDNTLYAISQKDGKFLAVDLADPQGIPADLTPKLEEPSSFLGCKGPTPELVCYGTPVVSDGVAYIGDYNGKVYAVDTKTGIDKWRKPVETKNPIIANPTLEGTSLIVAAGNKLYAINTKDGAFLWREPFKADGKIWSNPFIYGDKVYFGSLGHKLYAVDLESGQLYKEKSFDASIASTPLIVDNTIYIGTFENKFYALDAQTFEPKWDEPFVAQDWFWTKAAYHDGTVYVGSLDHNVYAIDAATGKSKWDSPVLTEGPIRTAAVIVGNVLLVASKSDQGFVYGLDPETGQEKWSPLNLGKIYADPWVEGDTVYYLNRQDKIYAVDAEKGTTVWSISP